MSALPAPIDQRFPQPLEPAFCFRRAYWLRIIDRQAASAANALVPAATALRKNTLRWYAKNSSAFGGLNPFTDNQSLSSASVTYISMDFEAPRGCGRTGEGVQALQSHAALDTIQRAPDKMPNIVAMRTLGKICEGSPKGPNIVRLGKGESLALIPPHFTGRITGSLWRTETRLSQRYAYQAAVA